MRALIIEDEQLAAERLSSMISESGKDIHVIDHFDTIRDTVDYLKIHQQEVDIMFCDVQLADGLSFSIFEKLNIVTPVIFTTAFDEYTLKAFKVNSVDYLLKPLRQDDLNEALEKYCNIHRRSAKIDLSSIQEYFGNQTDFKERFLVKSGKKYYNKSIDDITYFSSDKKIVYLHDFDSSCKY
ncbi:MAG: response regulator, partial [Cyclobacteriaceae bacterium]